MCITHLQQISHLNMIFPLHNYIRGLLRLTWDNPGSSANIHYDVRIELKRDAFYPVSSQHDN